MADNIVLYALVHQPRRIRLPALPLPRTASAAELEEGIFDESLNRFYFQKVARTCYYPMTDLLPELLDRGLRLNLGFSMSFIHQALLWDRALLDRFRALVRHPGIELVCVEPYHSFIFYMDIVRFMERVALARDTLADLFGERPTSVEVTEMFMSREIYLALDRLGFRGTLMEGRHRVLGDRAPTHLYHQGRNLALFARHKDLSDDVGYRFTQVTWPGYPLKASDYVGWVKHTPGDFVFVGWDFETFGEHHRLDSGIFDFVRWLPGEFNWQGVQMLTMSEALDRFRPSAREIALPVVPTSWAGLNGEPEFFFGSPAQFKIFLLMHHAYHVARLTGDPQLIDIALWLCQSDNLHLLGWSGGADSSEAEVSSYFTPGYWWNFGAERIPGELAAVYEGFIAAAAERLKDQGLPANEERDAHKTRTVEFRFYDPQAKHVALVGDLTGWSKDPVLLVSDGHGYWKATIGLAPGRYEYKFLVDGEWRSDPNCRLSVPDGFGALNNVVTVE